MDTIKAIFHHPLTFWYFLMGYSVVMILLHVFSVVTLSEVAQLYYGVTAIIALAVRDITTILNKDA